MSKTKLIVGASIIIIIILSIGFFIGFASYIPISKIRSRASLVQRQRTKETRLSEILNKAAPEIVSETLNGQDWYLANQKGKVVLAFFWSILCETFANLLKTIDLTKSVEGGSQVIGETQFPDRISF